MVLNRRPERQRSGRGSAADAVQEDVLREETRQLNVALPVELHQRLKVAAVQEGISVREWTAPGSIGQDERLAPPAILAALYWLAYNPTRPAKLRRNPETSLPIVAQGNEIIRLV